MTEGTVTVTRPDLVEQGQHQRHRPDALRSTAISQQILQPMAAGLPVDRRPSRPYPAFYWFGRHPGTIPANSAVADGAIFTDGGNTINGRPGSTARHAMGCWPRWIQGNHWTAITRRPRSQVGYAGFDNYETVFAPTHHRRPAGRHPVDQRRHSGRDPPPPDTWSQSLITDGWTAAAAARLNTGDVFTIANVFAVNPNTEAIDRAAPDLHRSCQRKARTARAT